MHLPLLFRVFLAAAPLTYLLWLAYGWSWMLADGKVSFHLSNATLYAIAFVASLAWAANLLWPRRRT